MTALPPSAVHVDMETTCRIEGCGRERARVTIRRAGKVYESRRTLCVAHQKRREKFGDELASVPIEPRSWPAVMASPPRPGEWSPSDVLSYHSAHARVRRMRGSASEQACIDCGTQAKEWSFNASRTDHVTTGPIWDNRRKIDKVASWSADPSAYEARCRGCHVKFDNARRNAS